MDKPTFPTGASYRRHRSPIDTEPTFTDVALNLTFQCNLSCVGCDRASFIKPMHSPPMTLPRLRAFFDEVQSEGVELKRIRLVGGEPTLHPDFYEMTALCAAYAEKHQCNIRIFSNRHAELSRQVLRLVKQRWPTIQLMGEHKKRSWVFPPMTRFEYVSPLDAGIDCAMPCPNMAARGKCGAGVDEVGYSLCPTAGPIDAILDLGARAKTIKQMLDRDFIRWQCETVCSRCGQFMAYTPAQLPQLWTCNGTPVSKSYAEKLKEKGFEVLE